MKPSDIRNMLWSEIQSRLEGDRERVYWALSNNGPCTTATLSLKMEMSILSVRPRVTELHQLGLAVLTGKSGHDGIYAAVALDRARQIHEARAVDPHHSEQLLIGATAG